MGKIKNVSQRSFMSSLGLVKPGDVMEGEDAECLKLVGCYPQEFLALSDLSAVPKEKAEETSAAEEPAPPKPSKRKKV